MTGSLMSLKGLNPKQKEAVETIDKNTMVIAGPGTGKTQVITRKIAYLFERELVPPRKKVLAITFTNKAAREMNSRVKRFNVRTDRIRIGTFHNFCVFVLRSYGDFIGMNRHFSFVTNRQKVALAKSVIEEFEVPMRSDAFLKRLAQLKNGSTHYSDYEQRLDAILRDAALAYQKRLLTANMIDFDDAILATVTLLKERPEILYIFHNAYPFILIDEMQDTNRMQLELIKLLGSNARNVMAVADDDQSIYGWRGAVPTVIEDYVQLLNAEKIVLSENYRSPQMILDAADRLVEDIQIRMPKKLEGRPNEPGDCVERKEFSNWLEEAEWVATKAKELYDKENIKYNEMIVLYRSRHPSFLAFEEAFEKHGVPYQHFGKEFNEPRNLLADQVIEVLKLIENPNNRVVLSSLLTALSDRFVVDDNLYDEYIGILGKEASVLEMLSQSSPRDEVDRFVQQLASFIISTESTPSMGELFDKTCEVLNIEGALVGLGDERKLVEEKYLRTLREKLIRNPIGNLAEFFLELELEDDSDTIDHNEDAVGLSTFHNAKGLEYKVVFIVALEEFIIPGRNTADEERRTLYVAMTRSKSKLFMSYAFKRINQYGTEFIQNPCPFLDDIFINLKP